MKSISRMRGIINIFAAGYRLSSSERKYAESQPAADMDATSIKASLSNIPALKYQRAPLLLLLEACANHAIAMQQRLLVDIEPAFSSPALPAIVMACRLSIVCAPDDSLFKCHAPHYKSVHLRDSAKSTVKWRNGLVASYQPAA